MFLTYLYKYDILRCKACDSHQKIYINMKLSKKHVSSTKYHKNSALILNSRFYRNVIWANDGLDFFFL